MNKSQKKVNSYSKQEYHNKYLYSINPSDWIICVYVFIGFIDLILNNKSLADSTNLFSLNCLEKVIKKNLKIFNNSKLKICSVTSYNSSKVKPDFSESRVWC